MKAKNYLIALLLCVFSISAASAFVNVGSENLYCEGDDPNLTLIELLQNGENYSIEITSVGCFHGKRQTVIISKEADVITASLADSSKVLTDTDIETLSRFELQLRALQIGGCTTVDTYVLRYGAETYRTSDGTCSWHGYRDILEIFS